jgi:hypothetical protein
MRILEATTGTTLGQYEHTGGIRSHVVTKLCVGLSLIGTSTSPPLPPAPPPHPPPPTPTLFNELDLEITTQELSGRCSVENVRG